MDSQQQSVGRIAALPFWSRYSRPLRITFPVAATIRDVAHTLGVPPDGYLLLWADALITASPGKLWTPTTAYLQSGVNNAHAIVIFYTTREEATDA